MTVNLVPNLLRNTPAKRHASVAPSAIVATIQANSVLVTVKLLDSEKSLGADGLDQPSVMPKINAPP